MRDKCRGGRGDIPIKIRPIKARTLMLENQNSSSPNTRTPRRLMKKTGGREGEPPVGDSKVR